MAIREVKCPCGTEFTWTGKRGKPATWCPACQSDRQREKVRNAMRKRREGHERVIGSTKSVACNDCGCSFDWIVRPGLPPTRCLTCKRAARRRFKAQWEQRNPERSRLTTNAAAAARYQKNRDHIRLNARARKFGVTVQWIKENEAGGCAICGCTEPTGKGWHIDHDHVTGAARAILCHHCNVAIGNLRDDPDLIVKAAEYVRHHHQRLRAAG